LDRISAPPEQSEEVGTVADERSPAVAQVLQRAGGVDAPVADLPLRRRTTWREDAITVALGAWMLVGVLADSWAHINRLPDTFFTPWHGLMYSGFVALFSWVLWVSTRAEPGAEGTPFTRRIPVGYGFSVAAGFAMLVAAVGDGLWHTIFGIEANFRAVLSPTHQVLFLSMLVLLATAGRAAFASDTPGTAPSLREFGPALASLAATLGLLYIYFSSVSPFWWPGATMPVASSATVGSVDYGLIKQGFFDILVMNVLLMGPLLLAMRRWRLPFGSATVLLTVPNLLVMVVHDFDYGWLLLAPIAGGLFADWRIARSSPLGDDGRANLVVATVTPLVLWSVYFVVLGLGHPITWAEELWAGSIVFAVVSGYALHLLTRPSRRPQPRQAEA
jgi:hypothetical protein